MMMMRRPTLDRYFFRLFVGSFLSTLVAIFALVYLIDMIEISRRGQFDDFGFGTIALVSALRVPSFIEQAFPFIILFSSIFTLLTLNRRLELVVARAAGVSGWQILTPFLVASLFLGLLATFAYNPISAHAKEMATRMTGDLRGLDAAGQSDRVPWIRQSGDGVESIIGARSIAEGGEALTGVTAYIMRGGVPAERIDAPSARLEENAWVIREPIVTRVGSAPERLAEFRVPTSLRPEFIEQRLADPEAIPIWSLGSKIGIARTLGYNADAFSMQYHTLLAKPALFMAMTLVAATVAMRFQRTGSSGRSVFGGVAAGFVLYVIAFLAKALGSNAIVPPIVAAWFPVLAAGSFGVTILLHQEDG